MKSELTSPLLVDYLGRVRSHLPAFGGKDILRELESSIRDRIDDMAAEAEREPDEEIVRRALSEMGDPEIVADAYVRKPSLVGGESFRSFVIATALVFAGHLVLIGVATMLARALQFGPIAVGPVGPNGFVSIVASSMNALFVDTGMMVFVFFALDRLPRRKRKAAESLRVDASPRAAAGRVVFAILVAVVLNFFRDKVFVVVNGGVSYPLCTEWFTAMLPMLTAVLTLSVVSDLLYLFLGETRWSLAVDALHGAAALACMLYMLRGDALMRVPPLEHFGQILEPLNRFLGELGTLVVGAMALIFAIKTVRRLIRCAQI